jgi:GNAT superfamily N-acetyltransferase
MSDGMLFRCGNFVACELQQADVPQLQRFYEDNPAYFELVLGAPPAPDEAARDFVQLPPEGWAFTRKWLVGFRAADGSLVACADLLQDLFARGVWHVGFFAVGERLHGTGVGAALYAHLEAWTRTQGARWLRLGVVRGNARAERFWAKVGYIDVVERRDYEIGRKRHTLRVMAKSLAGEGLEAYRALVPRDAAVPAAEVAAP